MSADKRDGGAASAVLAELADVDDVVLRVLLVQGEAARLRDEAARLDAELDAVMAGACESMSCAALAEATGQSQANVSRRVRRHTARAWGVTSAAPDARPWLVQQAEAFQVARRAQELRAEAYARGGGAAELRAFYGEAGAAACDEAEVRLVWSRWLRAAKGVAR